MRPRSISDFRFLENRCSTCVSLENSIYKNVYLDWKIHGEEKWL
jgi:hypothetical protein